MTRFRGVTLVYLSLVAEVAGFAGGLLLLWAGAINRRLYADRSVSKNNDFLKKMEEFEKTCV